MTHDATQDPIPNKKEFPQPPVLDVDEHRADLAELELSPEQEREILECLWDIVKMIVDADLGFDATSNALSAMTRKLFANSPDAECSEIEDERKDS